MPRRPLMVRAAPQPAAQLRACDRAETESLLRRSCAAPAATLSFCASRLSDATRRMMRPAFISPLVALSLKGRGPQSGSEVRSRA